MIDFSKYTRYVGVHHVAFKRYHAKALRKAFELAGDTAFDIKTYNKANAHLFPEGAGPDCALLASHYNADAIGDVIDQLGADEDIQHALKSDDRAALRTYETQFKRQLGDKIPVHADD